MKLFKFLSLGLLVAASLTACSEHEDRSVLDQPGEAVEENIGEPAQEGAEDLGDSVEDAGDHVEDAAD